MSAAGSAIAWSGLLGAVGVISSAPGATGLDVIGGIAAFGLLWWWLASADTDDDVN